MLAFVSLFLGLVSGPQTIGVAVSGNVAAVELRLDGETVGVLREEPWELEHDFGPGLKTRELVAIARDDRGAPLGVVKQLINVPRSAIESELMLDGWNDGVPSSGRLIWHSVESIEPTARRLELDGQPLTIQADGRFELPRLDPRSLHFVSAELHLPGGKRSTAEAVFGGVFGSSVQTDLTAVPLFFESGEPPDDVSGWLRSGDEPLKVVAFEYGAAELVIVRDEAALINLEQLDHKLFASLGTGSYRFVRLEENDSVRLVSGMSKRQPQEHQEYRLFPQSEPWPAGDLPLPSVLWRLELADPGAAPQHLSEAVAVAGRVAAASQKRRAVLLLVTDCAETGGGRSAAAVRSYLEELQVPLRVWMVETVPKDVGDEGFCSIVEDVSTGRRFLKAIQKLRRTLEHQHVAWVEGRHLPRSITLSERAADVRLREGSGS